MTTAEPVLLDTDTLSELSRGSATVSALARVYLAAFGRLTISSVTVFERLRGYRQAIRAFDEDAATASAKIWTACSRAQRQQLGDILIAGIAVARQIPLATRNTRDFEAITKGSELKLRLVDWTARAKRVAGSGG
jgi:predicted nucleic acid-binding protein